jgi:putative heme-binding domain-containing protein
MDFRFDPSSDRYEAISGMGQFGLTFDDWGNRFVCSNRNHNRHVVLPASAIRRNPFLAVPDTAEDTPVHGAASEVFPLSRNWTTSTLHTGTFTAACGVTVYRGDLLPVEFHGNSFTCEPTGNLVHRDVLEPAGATFRARRAREGVEFLASPDEWFRPVNLADGPDGALYVVDMYRAVIEHPEFMPPELKDRPDLVDGNDRGRIWRLVPDGDPSQSEGWPGQSEAVPRKMRRLSAASPEELTGLLAHPNGWWRQTAQRLLVERQAPGSVDALRFMVGAAQDPRARIHAAWTLAGLGELDQYLLLRLLGDDDPRVREHGVRLAEGKPADLPLVQKCVIELTGDADPRVRFQAALCLGEIDGDEIVEPLAAVALRDVSDRWTRLAVASAVPQRAGALVSRLLGRDHAARCDAAEDQRTLVQELSTLVGSRQDPSEIATVLGAIAGLGSGSDRSAASSSERAVIFMQIAAVAGLAEGADRRGKPFADLLRLFPEDDRLLADRIGDVFRAASNLAADREMLPEERERATRLLAHAPERIGGEVLAELVHGPDEPPALRVAAVQALALRRDPAASSLLLAGWKSYSPSVRNAVADALTRSPERIGALLDAIETGIVRPSELGPGPTRQIASERLPEELRTRASRLIARPTSADRGQVVGRYQSALELAPNVEHGRAVFEKNCATCHRVAGTGVDVGPDIADSRTRTPEALLVDILNPNAAIDANYVSYTLVTQSGRLLSGVIASETASSVTLRRAENVTDVVLRQDIDEMRSDGTSLMPEGLEKDLTVRDVADLIGFLKNWRYVDAAVRPDAR